MPVEEYVELVEDMFLLQPLLTPLKVLERLNEIINTIFDAVKEETNSQKACKEG